MKKALFVIYFLLLSLYAVFSYSLTDPNLVLTTWQPYWHFQQWMWRTFFLNARLLSEVYAGLIALLFGTYFGLIKLLTSLAASRSPKKLVVKQNLIWLAICILPLLFSYNALSHDVFNYIFNAKIVLIYHANPQNQIALNYLHDPWIRFMHNTNTPAPYGYGWIGISLIPYLLGLGKFTLTWILFRLFSLLGLAGLIFTYHKFNNAHDSQEKEIQLPNFQISSLVVLLNPLFLIEVLSNSHNDVWMMVPALLSLAIILKVRKTSVFSTIFSIALLAFSISIKLSTFVLLPIWVALFTEQYLVDFRLPKIVRSISTFIKAHYADLSVVLLFLPLLTPRSQQFNPWYLVWLIVWIPIMRWNWLKGAILVLSISSLYRYLPWLLAGGFSDQIIMEQKLITFIPLVVYLLIVIIKYGLTRNSAQRRVE